MNWFKHELWKNITQDPQYEEVQVNCPEIEIPNIDQDFYGKLLNQATAAGATFQGTRASIEGCDFLWNYDSQAQILRITCTRKPFYASCETVESKIRELVEKSKGGI